MQGKKLLVVDLTPKNYHFYYLYYILLREPRIFTPTITTPHKWGTVGSGLTPGSRPDGRTPEILDPEPENPEKPEIRKKVM